MLLISITTNILKYKTSNRFINVAYSKKFLAMLFIIFGLLYSIKASASTSVNTMQAYNNYLYLGLSNGELIKCTTDNSSPCQRIDSLSNGIKSIILANGYVYAGLNFGKIMQCSRDKADSCTTFASVGSSIVSLVSDYYIYAALPLGQIKKCDPLKTNSCESLVEASPGSNYLYSMTMGDKSLYTSITSYSPAKNTLNLCDSFRKNYCATLDYFYNPLYDNIAASTLVYYNYNGNKYLYAALSDGKVQKCDPDNANSCTTVVDLGSNAYLNTVAIAGNYAYAPLSSGVKKCDTAKTDSCKLISYNFGNEIIISSMVYQNYLYLGGDGGNLYKCSLDEASKSPCARLAHF